MKFYSLQNLVWVALLFLLSLPETIFAEGGLPPDGGEGFSIVIKNPLSVSTVDELLDLVLNLVINLGIPVITLTIMWSGFLFIKAQGKPEDIKEAKRTLGYVLLGTAIVLGVFTILSLIKGTIRAIGA